MTADMAPDGQTQLATGRPVGLGASLTTASQLVAALAGGLSTLVVARALGAAGTGAYSVVLATLAGLTVIAALGLDVSASYHIAGRRWIAANAVRQLQLAALCLGTLGVGLGLLAGILLRQTAFHGISLGTLALGLAALPFALSWSFSSSAALARDNYELAALPALLQGVAGLVFVAALAPPFGVTGAVAALTISHGFSATAAWFKWWRLTRRQAHAWVQQALPDLRRAVHFGYRANLTNVMTLINRRADIIILNAYVTHAAVGRYSVALSLTAMQLLVPSSLFRVLVPRVSRLGSEPTLAGLSRMIAKSVKHGLLASAITAAGMTLALLAVPLVFGSGFRPSVTLGWILVPGTAAYGAAYAFSAVIIGSGRPGYVLRAVAIITPATLVMYFVLIPRFGAVGAATASTLSYTGTFLLYGLYFHRVTGVSNVRALLPGRSEIDDYKQLLTEAWRHVRVRTT